MNYTRPGIAAHVRLALTQPRHAELLAAIARHAAWSRPEEQRS